MESNWKYAGEEERIISKVRLQNELYFTTSLFYKYFLFQNRLKLLKYFVNWPHLANVAQILTV